MKLIQKALLCAGLCFVAHSNATNIPIYNHNFDATYLDDGSSSLQVNNWSVEFGLVGVHNPINTSFVGEEGEGTHSNTLYMIDSATVSQSLGFKALENTDYKLTFDVGQRSEVEMQDYTVVVRAGNTVLASSTNAVMPSAPGTFARTTLQFRSSDSSAELLTVEVQTNGTGHTHFDNFEMSYEHTPLKEKAFLKPVAFGSELRLAGQSSGECHIERSLVSRQTANAYMVAVANGCHCNGSHKVLVSSLPIAVADNEYNYKDFYQCVMSSEQ